MVPRLNQSNCYMKRKLRALRVQNCNALVGEDTVLTSAGPQITPCHAGYYRVQKGNMRNFGLPIPMVRSFHHRNGYMKRKLREWRVQKGIALVGADTVLTSAWLQTTPYHGGYCRVQKGNMRNFWPTNPHGTAFSPKQWLYEKETTGMESSKMYYLSRCRYRT